MANSNLSKAKSVKNDEFYTQYNDIQKEVNAYLDFNPDTFRGKKMLLPCDDPEWSKFTRFFAENFELLGLKKLISTSYAVASKKVKAFYQPTLFETESPQFDQSKTEVRGKIFVLDHDTNANGRIDLDDLEWRYLEGDGDFRSSEVCKLRDEADIIVTNPPFSLFREFLAWIMEAKKQFLILGNKNAVSYTEVFPLIKSNQMWSGVTEWAGGMWFETKDPADVDKVVDGINMKNVASVWFTNLDHGRRHRPLELMTEADNVKYSRHKEIRGMGYFRFENYPAIEVPYTDAIPADYEGVMAVPRSFLDKYCPEQFEIVGIAEGESGKELGLKAVPKELKKLNKSLRDGQLYYMKDGYPEKPFARILIRARKSKGKMSHAESAENAEVIRESCLKKGTQQ
ncbi:MAG: adenine-specific methyltransferase EcoRI family protein [Kiritimatiellae bacterium]|nr:adenine-specific methyltransferase EcoRI family protein [Kiritimatiellia bacterium]